MKTFFTSTKQVLVFACLALLACQIVNAGVNNSLRRVIALDGTWQIAEGKTNEIPTAFSHTVPVPGLVSLAQPPFVEPGPKVADRKTIAQKDPRRDAFWYRRTFKLKGPVPETATLKVAKAMFGTRVILNGHVLGDHPPCFTPGYFDARNALRSGENELLIRVGADRDAVTQAVASGFDFEKERYIPGIFDSVELVLSGTPHIVNGQVAPEIATQRARIRLWLKGSADGDVMVEVREAKSGKIVGTTSKPLSAADATIDMAVPIANCQLWSPENPFLYELTARTAGDQFSTRFGMREFKFDPGTGRALLNGKPYFLRGSNFTVYRFFEDAACQGLPWDKDWVRRLHERVKDMHWNCLRYCIGFPPDEWYRVADEVGVLIQDEFPIWFGGPGWNKWPPQLQRDELAAEYTEWMEEHWNHPCVAIWDANNETSSSETTPAIERVRSLDLSDRPWDNSYNKPLQAGDMFESHPYHFYDANYKLTNLASADPIPQGNAMHNDGKHAVIINEYGWLWLNRDGTPTTLTQKLYQNLLGTNSTTAQRRHLYATYLAAETEFWRSHRGCAGVLHFTTLGYSRHDGQTSDHWIDVKKLQWEPEFYRYVRDSFAPVGLNLEFWSDKANAGKIMHLPVALINDLDRAWTGPVTLRVKCNNAEVLKLTQNAQLEPLGNATIAFDFTLPPVAGPCALEAELHGLDGKPVRSTREFQGFSGGAAGQSN